MAAAQTAPQAVSPNRAVQLVTVALQGTPQDEAVVEALREVRERSGEALEGSGLSIGYTGDVALFADSEEAFTDAERIVGIATIVLIVGLQLLIFRSPIAALFPIISVGLVFTLAQSLIAAAGKLFDFQVGTELTTLLTVVLFGIGTDYILFLLFRFRERLRAGDEPKAAVATAVERVGEAIASAAGVVIIAFSAMLLASLGFFTTLGPSLAVAVALMLLAALTLIPALLALIGPQVFWPSKSWQRPPKATMFGRLGRLVARRPVLVALVSGAVVVALAAGTLRLPPELRLRQPAPLRHRVAAGLHRPAVRLPGRRAQPDPGLRPRRPAAGPGRPGPARGGPPAGRGGRPGPAAPAQPRPAGRAGRPAADHEPVLGRGPRR